MRITHSTNSPEPGYRVSPISSSLRRSYRTSKSQETASMPPITLSESAKTTLPDLDPQILMLQKQLQLCEQSKAEAEIATICLAKLYASQQSSADTENPLSSDSSLLQDELKKARIEITSLQTKLDSAMDVISMLSLRGRQIPSQYQSHGKTDQHAPGTNNTGKQGDLINLFETCVTPSKTCSVEDQATSFAESSEDDGDHTPASSVAETPLAMSFESDRFSPSHKQRFKEVRSSIRQFEDDESQSIKCVRSLTDRPAKTDLLNTPIPALDNRVIDKPSQNPVKSPLPSQERKTLPAFFGHGIRYEPLCSETNVFRTVIISRIAPTTTLYQLLDSVRGGNVLSARILNTSSITTDCSAMVVFVREDEASAFCKWSQKQPLCINGLQTTVTHLQTPTWPMSKELWKAVTTFKHTRCLSVHSFPIGLPPDDVQVQLRLRRGNAMKTDSTIYSHLSEKRVLGLHFSSVEAAKDTMKIIGQMKRYAGCQIHFAPDPCARPAEILDRMSCQDESSHT